MSFDNRIALGGLLLFLALGGAVLVTLVDATPLLVGPAVLGLVGVVLIAVGVRADKGASDRHERVATRFHGKRLAGGLGFAALSGAVSAGFFAGFEALGFRIHLTGLGVVCLAGVLIGLIAAGTAWTRTCRRCEKELTRKRFAVREAPEAGRALGSGNATALASLLRSSSAASDAGALLGQSGTRYADAEWCDGCGKLVLVRFEAKARWFVDDDAKTIVDAARASHAR